MSDELQPATKVLSSTAAMEATIAAVTAWTAVLDGYIAQTFKPGIDFGAVEGETAGGQKFTGKPTLLKPGAEKLTLILGLRATFVQDSETWEMAGRPAGLIALKCLLVTRAGGEVVGEGRGACSVQEKKTINLAVKFAEKRAQIDAILRHTGLSAYFEGEERRAAPAPRPARPASARPSVKPEVTPAPAGTATSSSVSADLPDPAAIRDLQLKQIRALLPQAGLTEAEVCTGAGVARLEDLSAVRAQAGIAKLQAAARRKGPASA